MSNFHINETFWTLQGEGRWAGHRALFVRLPFCNYDCPWCDTEYNTYEKWSPEDFRSFCQKESARFAVITGGEPLANKHLEPILNILKELGFYIACETNGSYPAPKGIDFVTVSPKKYTNSKFPEYFIHPELFDNTHEWKYVVDDHFDFQILEQHAPHKKDVVYSLSPEFNQMELNTKRIIDFIKENPQWKLSLQTHKWINIP
mgnify:CR=1 FL=1